MRDLVKKASRKNNSTDAVHKRVTKTFQHHLNRLWVTTGQFKRHDEASKFIEEIKKNGNYKASSMALFIVVLKKYLRYIKRNQKQIRLPYDIWVDVLSEISSDYRHQMKKNQVLLMNKKKEETPTADECASMLKCVTDHLDSPTSDKYSYNLLKGLVFFYFHSLSGTRPGPILNLKYEQWASMRRGEPVYSTDHKTGAQFAVKFELTVLQVPWFEKMFSAFRKETGMEPLYIFPTILNQKEKSIARFVKDSLTEVAPKSLLTKSFNPTSMRRVLSTHMYGQKEKNPQLYQAHLNQTAHEDKTESRHYVMDLINTGKVLQEYGKLFRIPTERIRTLPSNVTPEEFDEMNRETIYFNCSEPDDPIFPHLCEQKAGPSASKEVREDLSDNESDMDEEDVTAMFEVEAHEQHVDAMEDDSDLEAEEMGNYLRSDGEGGDEDDEEEFDPQQEDFSDVDENLSVFSSTVSARKLQSVVPDRRRKEFIASLNKFSGRSNWRAEEKGLLLLFAQIKTTPNKQQISATIREKLGRNPHKNTVNKIYDKLKALVNRLAE